MSHPLLGADILWDTWGVPHIFAAEDTVLFHAFGFAQAHNHIDLILRLYGQARGRAAEYWGEEYLASDRLTRTMSIPARAHDWLRSYSPDFRRQLDAFAGGINRYAEYHPERLAHDVKVVLPVGAADIVAHLQRMLFTYLTRTAQSGLPPGSLPLIEDGLPSLRGIPGSNGWAIAPSYSRDGTSLLLINPHLPWNDLYTWVEAQLSAPGYDFYGITPVGVPVLTMGFNDHHGWTHTVNTFDGWDAYLLTPDGDGYRFDGAVLPFETERETLAVREPDGSLRQEELIVRRSRHGPVLGEYEGRPVAVRVVGLDHFPVKHTLQQWWQMGQAEDFTAFEQALRQMQLPMFTVIYADRGGHILSQYAGLVPVRRQGDWVYWAGLIPGDTSATLWTEALPYDDLPRVVDPPSGWVQNSNSPPWLTSLPPQLDPGDFPSYLAPHGLGPREQGGLRMLLEHGPYTLDDLAGAAGSTASELTRHLLDELIAIVAATGDALLADAAAILAAWDRRFDAGSRGAVLFAAWLEALLAPDQPFDALFALPWDPELPLETPLGLADPPRAVEALRQAGHQLLERGEPLDVAWGERHRLRLGSYDLPANGARDPLGVFRATWFWPGADDAGVAVGGTSFLAVVEFGEQARARALLCYGNASQPGSQHRGDQLSLYAAKELRPVWRERAEIEAHLEAREVIEDSGEAEDDR
ncbi:MAG TPA: penicillin acylase family protein [Thermomicrobiaceae bacterium]|nr:penicillin acylase family protein [Thermomicrobiaceae bacterium]